MLSQYDGNLNVLEKMLSEKRTELSKIQAELDSEKNTKQLLTIAREKVFEINEISEKKGV